VERFQGGLLGLMVGDALGAHFEGWPPAAIALRYPTPEHLLEAIPPGPWRYTDDTQMALGIAEALVTEGKVVTESLCDAWLQDYDPARGYGATQIVIEAMRQGEDFHSVAENLFPGGSFGNGAAMRVAPVGLFFHDDLDQVWEQARCSAVPTHVHPLAVEGAQLVALAVAYAARRARMDRAELFDELQTRCRTKEFRVKLELASRLAARSELHRLGNGVPALESAVTAIACWAFSPDSYQDAIIDAIFLGGDTDTIAAMAGAISGAHLGARAIPPRLLDQVEDGDKGRTYATDLAAHLYEAYCRRAGGTVGGPCPDAHFKPLA
jgi:poly(ADP-ribose) glycohydrolase ARH3